jgi:pimeloyl-ACP methyl ester carboxylesterase
MKNKLLIFLLILSAFGAKAQFNVWRNFNSYGDQFLVKSVGDTLWRKNGGVNGNAQTYTKNGVDQAISTAGGSFVPTTRTISTGYGLTGGGNLSANRTIAADTSILATKLEIETVTPIIGGEATRIAYPKGSNGYNGLNVVIYFHGNGEDENSCFTQVDEKRITDQFLQSGWLVASSNGSGSGWGNQASIDAYYSLYVHLLSSYNVQKVIFIGQSMGALTSLNLLATGSVNVAGWYGIYPATNLRYAYDNGFSSIIESSYGFSGSGGYDAATSGHDPNLKTSSSFPYIWYRMTASYDDTVIPRANNSDLFQTKMGGNSIESYIVTHTGNHGDPSAFVNFDALTFTQTDINKTFVGKKFIANSGEGFKYDTATDGTVLSAYDATGRIRSWQIDKISSGLKVYLDGANDYVFNINSDGNSEFTKQLSISKFLQGSVGTDSIMVHDNTTKKIKLISASGSYLPLTGGILSGNLTGTNAYFSGNLGIGTSTPVYKAVFSNSGNNGLEIDPTSNSGNTTSILSYNRTSSSFTPINFAVSGLGIGIEPTEKLHVSGNAKISGSVTAQGTTTGTAGTDSIAVINNGLLKKIAPSFYAKISGGNTFIGTQNFDAVNMSSTAFANGGLVATTFIAVKNGGFRNDVQTETLTGNRIATLQNKSGTVAYTDDISAYANALSVVDATSTPYTEATLNSTYPTAAINTQIICPNLTLRYFKYDSTNWYSQSITIMP